MAKIGKFLMVVGSALVIAALALFLLNQREETQAADASAALMPQIVEAIQQRQEQPAVGSGPLDSGDRTQTAIPLPAGRKMTVVEIDGHDYIGFVGIPSLGLELPVMADWSYAQLRTAPCRYAGSIYTDDLVLMAHNYKRHFGPIRRLRAGDTVTFTDMEGKTIQYEVVAVDVLTATDVEDMTAGEYDLTLFTCTYGGESRITVRCDRVGA